jgi:hypothetical protein
VGAWFNDVAARAVKFLISDKVANDGEFPFKRLVGGVAFVAILIVAAVLLSYIFIGNALLLVVAAPAGCLAVYVIGRGMRRRAKRRSR